MVSPHVFYQLILFALLWLVIILHLTRPTRPVTSPFSSIPYDRGHAAWSHPGTHLSRCHTCRYLMQAALTAGTPASHGDPSLVLGVRSTAGRHPTRTRVGGERKYHSGACGRRLPTLSDVWRNERIEQVTERHHSSAYAGLHRAERLAQPGRDLAMTQALVVGDLDSLALLRAKEGEGVLDGSLPVSFRTPFLRRRSS